VDDYGNCPLSECLDWCRHQEELQPTDCDGTEDCAAAWHVHGCYADGGGCTEPHPHVIAAS
jgi:hypothetical protein